MKIHPLAAVDSHHLDSAHGWVGLLNFMEANTELDRIALEFQSHPDVLALRVEISVKTQNWVSCVEFGDALVANAPDRDTGWIGRSVGLQELHRTQEAFDKLLPAAERFSKDWMIRYNLACYSVSLGRTDEAITWLKRALAIDRPQVTRNALDDCDLKSLLARL